MLANKAEAAFRLLQLHAGELTVPDYILEALAWIRECDICGCRSGKTTLLIRFAGVRTEDAAPDLHRE
jgi:hypothetical protein